MPRLDIERQNQLTPQRFKYAKDELEKLGIEITFENENRIEFYFRNSKVQLFPYSGWHTGRTIIDGRGIEKLLKQLKQ